MVSPALTEYSWNTLVSKVSEDHAGNQLYGGGGRMCVAKLGTRSPTEKEVKGCSRFPYTFLMKTCPL